jgi:hypothetical protein
MRTRVANRAGALDPLHANRILYRPARSNRVRELVSQIDLKEIIGKRILANP